MFFRLALLRLSKLAMALAIPRFRRALFRTKVLAASEHRFIFSLPWRTVVDIGANRGQFALAAREWSSARIIAVEPLPGPAAVLSRIFEDDPRVSVHVCAIGPDEDIRMMHVSGRDDSSSLHSIGPEQSRLFPGTAEIGLQRINMAPLDKVVAANEIESPALLKLDVQGFEYEALLGCIPLLQEFQSIYCECSFVELYLEQELAAGVVSLLSTHGFSLSGVHNPTYDEHGRCIQADMLFTRSPS